MHAGQPLPVPLGTSGRDAVTRSCALVPLCGSFTMKRFEARRRSLRRRVMVRRIAVGWGW